jgi:hypothetical protein
LYLATPEGSLTERSRQFARIAASAFAIAVPIISILGRAHVAWGQAAIRDQSGTLTATSEDEKKKTWLQQRFGGSFADFSTYVGSGSFYSSGYSDPYVSNALMLRPMFNLGTRFKLALNARVYLEEEYTKPDTSNGRRFYPLDSWLWLAAKNLYTMPRAKVTFGGTLRAVIPTSYESSYAHLVTGVGLGGNAKRQFEFGSPNAQGKRWELTALFGSTFTKYLRTSAIRGGGPADSSGCRQVVSAEGSAAGGPAETDHCGGPLSTSYAVTTIGNLALARGRYSLSVSISVINEFKYAVDPTVRDVLVLNPTFTTTAGRVDNTWGIISFGYDVTDHVSLSLGVASFQPALDSRYQHLRFPFFDFSGPNANNFTQAFVGVTGTL